MSVIAIAGGVQAFSKASGGKVYAYNALSTTPAQVAPANPQRVKITFHNPGDVDIFIAPLTAFTTFGGTSPSALAPSGSALGGCYRVFSNGGSLEISGECQGGWQAFAASATGKPLTVTDSNI